MAEPIVTFEDVTTVMRFLDEIASDVREIRTELVEDDGEDERERIEAELAAKRKSA
jgi:hypothetical protein